MFFHRQFETFDPEYGRVPDYPFTFLPEIAFRARSILSLRNKEAIILIARKIDDEVQGYFADEKDMASLKAQEKIDAGMGDHETYFDWDGGTIENGRWTFKDEMLEELGIPTPENTSEVDALKAVLEKRDGWMFWSKEDEIPEEYSEGRDFELFAVLSLWLVADALEAITTKRSNHSTAIAADYAIKAMDAVCYAEHLREADFSRQWANKVKEKALSEAIQAEQSEMRKQAAQDRKAQSIEMNKARHARTYEAQQMVIEEWAKRPSAFFSTEKAGIHFADWLAQKGYRYEPRTITGWIRTYAKQNGIRLR